MTPPVPPEAWPFLSAEFGLHPRDVVLTPEEGGLTFDQLAAYVEAAGDIVDARRRASMKR